MQTTISLNREFELKENNSNTANRVVRNHKDIKLKKIYEQILNGFGQGHGCEYQPWLQIRRKNSSSKSNQVVAWMEPLGRVAHYFSRGEYKIALLLLWLGVVDLREQYPLWPISHPHPLEGTPGSRLPSHPWVRGLMDVANEAGITHGVEVGTNIPYVATLDLLATCHTSQGLQLLGVSCKPINSRSIVIRPRTLERFELEKRYLDEVDGRYFVAHSGLVTNLMAGQLELWINDSSLNDCIELHQYVDQLAYIFNENKNFSINECAVVAAESLRIDADAVWKLFRYCAWHQLIDIDPTVRIVTSYPMQRGGHALKARLREHFFGEK